MPQPPTGPRYHRTHNRRSSRNNEPLNSTGPHQRGAFYQNPSIGSSSAFRASAGYINPAPNLYPGHSWPTQLSPGAVDNTNFPVLPPATDGSSAPAQNVGPTWASQFGLEGLTPPMQDGEIWLTPRFPNLKPKNTGMISEPQRKFYVPRNPKPMHLDVLFTSEALQRNRFAGLTTAEAQLFAAAHSEDEKKKKAVPGQPNAWFQEAFGSEILNTSSLGWVSILRTERWVPFLRKLDPNGPETNIWAWENERVVNAVKPSVVLADAILQIAFKGRW